MDAWCRLTTWTRRRPPKETDTLSLWEAYAGAVWRGTGARSSGRNAPTCAEVARRPERPHRQATGAPSAVRKAIVSPPLPCNRGTHGEPHLRRLGRSGQQSCPPEHYDAFDCSALIGQPSGRSRHQPTAAERSLGAVQRRAVHAVSCPRQSWRVCRMMIRRSLWPCAARWGGLTDEPADGSWTRPPVGGSRKRILFDNRVYRKCEGQPVGCSLPIDVRRLSEGIQDEMPCVSRDGIRRGAGAVRLHALPFVPR